MANFMELSNLTLGSVVELTSGEKAEFIKLKRKNFEGKIDGKLYNIPISLFKKVLEVKEEGINSEYLDLNKGDLFIINDGKNNALVFKFEEIRNGRIIGTNPITDAKTRIDTRLFFKKL